MVPLTLIDKATNHKRGLAAWGPAPKLNPDLLLGCVSIKLLQTRPPSLLLSGSHKLCADLPKTPLTRHQPFHVLYLQA